MKHETSVKPTSTINTREGSGSPVSNYSDWVRTIKLKGKDTDKFVPVHSVGIYFVVSLIKLLSYCTTMRLFPCGLFVLVPRRKRDL